MPSDLSQTNGIQPPTTHQASANKKEMFNYFLNITIAEHAVV
jgi:hypothetical protein